KVYAASSASGSPLSSLAGAAFYAPGLTPSGFLFFLCSHKETRNAPDADLSRQMPLRRRPLQRGDRFRQPGRLQLLALPAAGLDHAIGTGGPVRAADGRGEPEPLSFQQRKDRSPVLDRKS